MVVAIGLGFQFLNGGRLDGSAGSAPDDSGATPTFVGAQICASCHEQEYARWLGSQHDLAMQPANAETVIADFDDASFEYEGITSRFSTRDDKYFARTDGPDGQLHDYEIAYTFGVYPLQQYLIALPAGRYQALSIAWDSRPREAGGQRWFHLYPNEHVTYTDVLHWTKPSQNWNNQCAECHSTGLRKNYDAVQNRYATAYAEIDVACEACHGPGSRHVVWAQEKSSSVNGATNKGLVVNFSERQQASWVMNPESGIARRSQPIATHAEVETCAQCHARRATLFEGDVPGLPLLDTHRPALLEAGLYQSDGQMQDEVYNYGSFLQSRMYAAGVTCSNCHEPHSLQLRASGNEVCATCHLPARFDTPRHHFHKAGSTGAECAACHMPIETYMVVDPRHDHSFRIPRPDFTARTGVPNACNQCHQDKSAQWAIDSLNRWHGVGWSKRPHFAEALQAGRMTAANAESALAQLALDSTQPSIARATAISLLPAYLSPASLPALEKAASDADPLMRLAAAEALEVLPPEMRLQLAAPLLGDSIRTVRMAAAASLVGDAERLLTTNQRVAFERALADYQAAQQGNLDRPESHVNLGLLQLRRGQLEEAKAAYEAALKVAPWFVPARVNLADVLRLQGRESEAEAMLRAALAIDPANADLHYALGLSLVRQKRMSEAIENLDRAAELRPQNPRFPLTYALALQAAGKGSEAIEVLRQAHMSSPGSRDLLLALIEMHRARGEDAAAREYARRLMELSPGRSAGTETPE